MVGHHGVARTRALPDAGTTIVVQQIVTVPQGLQRVLPVHQGEGHHFFLQLLTARVDSWLTSMSDSIQLLGVNGNGPPVVLASTRVHGDRQLLRDHPDLVHLYIRKGTGKRLGKRKADTVWRLLDWLAAACALCSPGTSGRQMKSGDTAQPSPTVFRDGAYGTLQHALLACLLWFSGGSSSLRYTFYPQGVQNFPVLHVSSGSAVGIPDGGELDLHLLSEEPTHRDLLSIGAALRERGVPRCLVLVGTLQPVLGGAVAVRPQLRGLLCHADTLRASGPDGAYPVGAVEHGWYACLTRESQNANHLWFARDAQDVRGPLVPAVLPSLSSLGMRLWRCGSQAMYALADKGVPAQGNRWEDLLRPIAQA